MADAPFTDYYTFTGPDVAIRCFVDYDREQERWVAKSRHGWVGFGHSPNSAALNCFRAWMLDEGAFYEQDTSPTHDPAEDSGR